MSILAETGSKRSLVGRALAWWLGELAAIGRDAARRLGRGARNAIVIEAGERYWLLRQRERPLGQIDRASTAPAERQRMLRRLVAAARRGPVIVEVPQERVLARRLALPAAAQGELDRVLQFEIARHFPFPAERLHFRHRVVARTAEHLTVDLVAVPRDSLAEIMAELSGANIAAAGARLGGSDEILLSSATLGIANAQASRRVRALGALLAACAVAALVSAPLHQEMQLADVEHALATLRPQAQAALAAREAAQRELDRRGALLRLATARPPLVRLLDALSRTVPDGAWLTSLGISGRDIALDGLSASAAATALALEGSGLVQSLTFRAPVARDPATGLEHFQFAATLAEGKP